MTLVLRIHAQGTESYHIGGMAAGEESLAAAIWTEAETIATSAGSDLLEAPTEECRAILAEQVFNAATTALVNSGDNYRDPAGVLWSLSEEADS